MRLAEQAVTGHGNGDGRTAMLAAEATIDLAACRAIFDRAANLIDQHQTVNPTTTGTKQALTALFGEAQAAKAFIAQAAPRIVDRALALSGWRRLPEWVATRRGLPRRPRPSLHAPARRQPRIRVLGRAGPRPPARPALGHRPTPRSPQTP